MIIQKITLIMVARWIYHSDIALYRAHGDNFSDEQFYDNLSEVDKAIVKHAAEQILSTIENS